MDRESGGYEQVAKRIANIRFDLKNGEKNGKRDKREDRAFSVSG